MNYLIGLAGLLVSCSVPPQSMPKPASATYPAPAAYPVPEIEIRVQVETTEPKKQEPAKPLPKPAGLKECAEIDTGNAKETANLKLDCMIELAPGKRK